MDISPDDLETSTKWKFKGHPYFAVDPSPAGETYEDTLWAVRRRATFTKWPIYVQYPGPFCKQFMLAKGACVLPNTLEYLSVHIDIAAGHEFVGIKQEK